MRTQNSATERYLFIYFENFYIFLILVFIRKFLYIFLILVFIRKFLYIFNSCIHPKIFIINSFNRVDDELLE